MYIPNKIKVGYQNREGTYTGKLAYVIYYDDAGKIHKEPSWENWRDKKINPDEFNNDPIEGFVINKNVGGYVSDFGMRKSHIRVYDPRGFEVEIELENLLYILENSNCIKGKGLEGSFVYAWDKTDLLLLPTDSPDYKKYYVDRNLRKISNKDLKVGYTYKTNKGEEVVYLGKFHEYELSHIYGHHYEKDDPRTLIRTDGSHIPESYSVDDGTYHGEARNRDKGMKFWFYGKTRPIMLYGAGRVFTLANPSKSLINYESEYADENTASYLSELNSISNYVGIDLIKKDFVPISLDDFLEEMKQTDKKRWPYIHFVTKNYETEKNYPGSLYTNIRIETIFNYFDGLKTFNVIKKDTGNYRVGKTPIKYLYVFPSPEVIIEQHKINNVEEEETILREIYYKYQPGFLQTYLKNGTKSQLIEEE